MGYELWTSPITGYRRNAILEPLQSCPADAPAAEMARSLERKDIDVAGVQHQNPGPVIGYVTRTSLTGGRVKDHLRPMTAEHLVSDTTPLASLLSLFRMRKHIFVLVGSEVRGIVTRADLNKPPVRVYLFGLVSLLEMHLGFWVRAKYGEDSWQGALKATRLDAVKKLQAERKLRNQEMPLVECLQFCDRRDLVLVGDDLRVKLSLGKKTHAMRLLKRAEDLRNLLAHSHQDLARGSSWERVIDLVEWVEMLVHKSDECVEEEARRAARRGEDGLWVSA